MALEPRDHVLIQMKNGDPLLRHAVVLTQAYDEVFHLVLSPNRALREVDFSDDNIKKITPWNGVDLPAGVTAVNCVLDVGNARGRFTPEELTQAVAEAGEGPRPAPGASGGPPACWPAKFPTLGGGGPPTALPLSAAADKPPPEWHSAGTSLVTLVAIPALKLEAGQEYVPTTTEGCVFKHFGVAVEEGGIEVPFRRVVTSDIEAFADEMRSWWKVAPSTPKAADEEDVRTLPVRWDGAERIREFGDSVGRMHMEEFTNEEFPNAEIGRHSMWWLKMVKRQALTGVTHHTKWVHESGIHLKERAVYEHETLSHAIDAFVTIDQVNCPNLLGFEILIRRLMLLEEAFSGEGSADFSMSEDWMGLATRPGGALVAPALLKGVAQKQSEKNAIAKERRKAAEERRFRSKDYGGGDGGGKADGKGGKDKGKNKKEKGDAP